ncbi:MAG: hypothetical protein WD055_01440 [Candidatus Dependentiae bacterium]
MKKLFFLMLLVSFGIVRARWQPTITEKEYIITPKTHETCYQYAERKVQEMINKYANRRIVGSIWLSEYWAHHYYGAIEYRNYTWKAV